MKSFKKIMSFALAFGTAFGVMAQTACNNDSPESNSTTTTSSTQGTDTANNDDNGTVTPMQIPAGSIALSTQNGSAPIYIDANSASNNGLSLIANAVSSDFELVTGQKSEVFSINGVDEIADNGVVIIAGILDDKIIQDQNLSWDIKLSNGDDKSEEWERYQIQVVEDGDLTKIVIGGSDKRGTIYGLFYLSQDLGGVSPWVWWADAKPTQKQFLAFTKEEFEITSKTPSVKYRGIFLNDEAPALSNFVSRQFGDYNYLFYDNVFELILRLKGNYLWPAMWGDSFSDDGISQLFSGWDMDNLVKLSEEERTSLASAILADHYGVVMGLSHHEPMYRAGIEWQRDQSRSTYNKPTVDNVPLNTWNYFLNRDNIYDFWYDGYHRNKDLDNLVPIGMRGEGDSELRNPDGTPFTLGQNIQLLKDVIYDQKGIIKDAGHENDTQVLALYKEVEKYWYGDAETPGLNQMEELKNDIIILCEDNNNFLRTLPKEDERDRRWGMYYHFDYNGGPKTYMWINVTPLQRVWDNMTMAYDYMVRDLWIVNVGDLKPMELPISYFLDMAYDFDTYGTSNPNSSFEYTENWVKQQFSGLELTGEQVTGVAQLITDYVDMNGRKRPETIFVNTFSQTSYNEAQVELQKALKLQSDADEYYKIFQGTEYDDTFYQLVYYPAAAVAEVNKMWLFQGLHELYYNRGSALANSFADLVKDAVQADKDLMNYYNNEMSEGYWKGMMDQVNHTAFTAWNHESATLPEPKELTLKSGSELIVDVPGDENGYTEGEVIMPDFDSVEQQQYALTLSNGGSEKLDYNLETSDDWIKIEKGAGSFEIAKTLGVTIDWSKVTDDSTGTITITSGSQTVTVAVSAKVIDTSSADDGTFFMSNGVISINSNSYTDKKAATDGTEWIELEDYGKNQTTMKMMPTTVSFEDPADAPYVEYKINIPEDGKYVLSMFVGPSNNRYYDEVFLRYGIQFDGTGNIGVQNALPRGYVSGDSNPWGNGILNMGRVAMTSHELTEGSHTLRIYGVDAGLLFEKITLSKVALLKSHFGPRETYSAGKEVDENPLIHYVINK